MKYDLLTLGLGYKLNGLLKQSKETPDFVVASKSMLSILTQPLSISSLWIKIHEYCKGYSLLNLFKKKKKPLLINGKLRKKKYNVSDNNVA